MHQILFQFPFLPGVTPGPSPLGALPPNPRRGEGREGKGRAGRERVGEGKGDEGKGRGSLRHCRWGIDAPALRYVGNSDYCT